MLIHANHMQVSLHKIKANKTNLEFAFVDITDNIVIVTKPFILVCTVSCVMPALKTAIVINNSS